MEKEYTIDWIENKSNDWKVATLSEGGLTYDDVSINRVNKKGETFPNFDGITQGATVKGNLWTSPQGKHYLYAPKPQAPQGSAPRAPGGFKAGMQKAIEQKQEGIRQSQENKELGIKLSSTIRMAVDMVIAILKDEQIIEEGVIKGEISKWRKWFWDTWEDPKNYPPFP